MLSRLLRQGGSYAIAGALLKGAGLILAPLLLNAQYLPVEDYGSLALLMVTAQLAVFVAGLGQPTALLRFMSQKDAHENADALPGTALAVSAGAGLLAGLLLWLGAEPLARLLTGSSANASLLVPVAVYVAIKCAAGVPLALLRVQERAGRYTVAVVFEMAVLIVLAYYQLAVRGNGLEGLLQSYAWSAGVALFVLLAFTAPSVRWRLDPAASRALLKFGVPLVLAALAGWFLNAGDRYILNWLADREAVATYEWSARLAGLINMLLVQSFQLAFTVVGLKALASGAAGFYRRTFRHFTIWTGAAILVLSIWTPEGMRVLIWLFDIEAAYLQATTLVFPLALGFGAYGIYIIVNNALLSSGRTGVIGANIVGVATLNAVLNILLIPWLGALGAALSTTFSYAVLAGVAAWTARKEIQVTYPWRIPAIVTALLLAGFAAGMGAELLPSGVRSVAKLGVTAAYLGAIPLLG
ncbi:MAG: oligosaccharide flippase family protein, partial [Rhodothermales bacterium]|nr:oligosaccharide flippase family protein [Rhodothermales bacterium]